MPSYGLSFQPGADSQDQSQRGLQTPVQEAVRLLSLRLPSVVGARAISPQALLQAPGAAGLPALPGMGGNALLEWLRRLMQGSGAQMPPQASGVMDGGLPSAMGMPMGGQDFETAGAATSSRPLPRVSPVETGKAGDGKEQDVIDDAGGNWISGRPKIGGEVQTAEPSPFEQYGGFPIDQSDYWRG